MWNQSSTGQTKPHIMCLPGFCSKWKEHKRDRVLIEHSISSGRTWSQTCKSNEVTWSFTRVQDLCYTLVYCSCSGSSPSRLQMSRPSSPRSLLQTGSRETKSLKHILGLKLYFDPHPDDWVSHPLSKAELEHPPRRSFPPLSEGSSVLLMPGPASAFDTVHHHILLGRQKIPGRW